MAVAKNKKLVLSIERLRSDFSWSYLNKPQTKNSNITYLWYLVSGSIKIQTNGTTQKVSAGTLIHLNPSSHHHAFNHTKKPFTLMIACINSLKKNASPILITPVDNPTAMLHLWKRALSSTNSPDIWMKTILEEYESQLQEIASSQLQPLWVTRTCADIFGSIASEHKISDMAKRVNLSRHQFTRTFTKHLGVSPSHFTLTARLNYAKTLLRWTTFEIATIAIKVGFYDSAHFCRLFLKHTNKTPTDYRLSK